MSTTLFTSVSPQTAAENTSPLSTSPAATLRDCVDQSLTNYLAQLDGAPVTDVYQLVLSEVEAPLLEQIMRYTRNNQTKASNMLGLNRGTLRKKLKQYGLL
jgi:Fis family transcriptional regulator